MNAAPVIAVPIAGSGRPSGRGVGFGILGPIAAVAVCFPLAALALVAPKFAGIFQDFGVALPVVSALLINVGVALASPLGLVVLVLLAIVIMLAVGFAWRAHKAFGLVLVCLCGAWCVASFGILIFGLFLPLNAMIQSLEEGGAV